MIVARRSRPSPPKETDGALDKCRRSSPCHNGLMVEERQKGGDALGPARDTRSGSISDFEPRPGQVR